MKISKSFTVYSNLTWYFGTVWTKNIFIPFNICWNISLDSFDIIQPNQPIKIYVGMRKVLWQISRKVPLTECWNWCRPAAVSSGSWLTELYKNLSNLSKIFKVPNLAESPTFELDCQNNCFQWKYMYLQHILSTFTHLYQIL